MILTIEEVAKKHNVSPRTIRTKMGNFQLSKYLIARNKIDYNEDCENILIRLVTPRKVIRSDYAFNITKDEHRALKDHLAMLRRSK